MKRTSVIIAAHNEGDLLRKTIESCLEAHHAFDFEIVVADDASSDGSVARIHREFPQVRIVRHEQRQGASPTKALGASAARSDILIFLDGHCKAERGALEGLAAHVDALGPEAIVTPKVACLDVGRWMSRTDATGSGYTHDLVGFDTEWVPEIRLRGVELHGRRYFESPGLIGCALAVHRDLYEKLWGFDRQMRSWGIEDLDFGLKCWLMGHRILHAPEVLVGHRFREKFHNYSVPYEHILLNKLRMARKVFTESAWNAWLQRCRAETLARSEKADPPEGMWAHAWHLFENDKASVEQERAYLHSHRRRDEFWFADRFGLAWPKMPLLSPPLAARALEALVIPSHAPSSGPSHPPAHPMLKIVAPVAGATFAIDGNGRMPQIQLRAVIQGVQPDPTPVTAFNWTINLSFQCSGCTPGAQRTTTHPTITKTAVGGTLTVPFTAVRGGTMSVKVTAVVAGQQVQANVGNIKIVGTNPPLAILRATLPHNTLKRIANFESGDRQFAAAADGGVAQCPLFSKDNLGGAGIMQLTNPAPTDEEIWNWRRNVATGIQVFNQKVTAAKGYPAKVRSSPGFQTLVTKYNQARTNNHLPLVNVQLPDFTSGDFNNNLQQLELDSIRGFNGFGGKDAFGFPLHEFRVAMDSTTGLLKVIVDASGTHGSAVWERVPPQDRPQNFGDPAYVDHVLASQP